MTRDSDFVLVSKSCKPSPKDASLIRFHPTLPYLFHSYIRPEFFINNPLLSFVQYAIGPYTDELGNVLPQAVEGLGVPLDPLAFAGLLGAYMCTILA